MDYAALAVALLALILALAARAKAAGLARSVEDAAADARRRSANAETEYGRELEILRGQVASLARGDVLDPAMVAEGRTWRDVSLAEGLQLVASAGVCVVDVRTRAETAAGIIPGALLIPVDELEERQREIPRDARTTLVYCASGARSAAACEHLSRAGFANLVNLVDGFSTWTGPRARPS